MNFDIRKYFVSNNIEFKEDEKNYQLKECPSCGDLRYKFGISKNKEYVSHCFVCGESFNIYQLMMLLENISYRQAYKFVNQKNIRRVSKISYVKKKELNKNKSKNFDYSNVSILEYPKEFELLNTQIAYTKKRGLEFSTIKAFDLRVCYSGKWKNRLIIPIKYNGKLVGWQGRDITDKAKVKIKSCKGFKKSKFIINYDDIANMTKAILCEGPFDVMKAYQSTRIIGAFGIMGKELSKDQLNLLLKTKLKRIYIGLDPDYPESREKAARQLMPYFQVLMTPIPENIDLGAMDCLSIRNCLEKSSVLQSKYSSI